MAKKNIRVLKEEAENIIKEARKKQAELLREAKELESKNLILLGEKTIELLNGKCQLENVEKLAIELDLFNKNSDEAQNKSDSKE